MLVIGDLHKALDERFTGEQAVNRDISEHGDALQLDLAQLGLDRRRGRRVDAVDDGVADDELLNGAPGARDFVFDNGPDDGGFDDQLFDVAAHQVILT